MKLLLLSLTFTLPCAAAMRCGVQAARQAPLVARMLATTAIKRTTQPGVQRLPLSRSLIFRGKATPQKLLTISSRKLPLAELFLLSMPGGAVLGGTAGIITGEDVAGCALAGFCWPISMPILITDHLRNR